jgi:hypothetical protein
MYCFIILSWYKCFFCHSVQMVKLNISFSRGKEAKKGLVAFYIVRVVVFEGIINISNSSKLFPQRVLFFLLFIYL